MKTKDLIKQLKEADPTGELHVRIDGDGGFPLGAYSCAGYWDGPCTYEKDKKLYIDYDNDKVRISTIDSQDWVYNRFHKTVKNTPPREQIMLPFDETQVVVLNKCKLESNRDKGRQSVINGLKEHWNFWDKMLKELQNG